MDDIVKQAMAKWPNVPHVYGWLSLDRRGSWRIKGDVVSSETIAGFINRNYDHDSEGRWFFQNGPQRVFAELEYTPFVYRIIWSAAPGASLKIEAHTGAAVALINAAWIDNDGVLLLATEHGIGLLDDRNLELLLPALTDAAGRTPGEDAVSAAVERLQGGGDADLHLNYAGCRTPIHAIAAADVAAKFAFVPKPQQPAGEEPCP